MLVDAARNECRNLTVPHANAEKRFGSAPHTLTLCVHHSNMAAAAAAASSASGSASSAPAAATEVPDVIVTVTGKDGFSTKASLNLLRKYLKLVKEIPDFGEDDEPDEDTELPLSHDGVVITHVLDFAKQFDAAGFVAHKVRRCLHVLALAHLLRLGFCVILRLV